MAKENENIHIFIVEEEYRKKKIKQNTNDSFLRKAEPLLLDQQNHESAILELKKQHSNFEVNQEDETLPSTQGAKQLDGLQLAESPNSSNDLDLLVSLQKMKTEEQALLEQKQRLVATEQSLHNKLVKEMERRKATIANLISEITDLQNRTKQIGEELGIDINNKTQVLR
jgi:hypothetical protein